MSKQNSSRRRGFFVRAMLISSILTCVMSTLVSYIVGNVAVQFERKSILRNYDIALNQLYVKYNEKHDNFSDLLLPLFRNPDGYEALCTMLTGEPQDFTSLDGTARNEIVNLLNSICDIDSDIISVLLYVNDFHTLYQYSPFQQMIKKVPVNANFKGFDPYTRQVLSAEDLEKISNDLTIHDDSYYAFAAHINARSKNIVKKSDILIVYSAKSLTNTLLDKHLDYENLYLITDAKGNTLFSSNPEIEAPVPSGQEDLFQSNDNPSVWTIGGKEYYSNVLYNNSRSFAAASFINKKEVDSGSSSIQDLVIITALILCAVSLVTYQAVCRISAKKIGLIEYGMANIKKNNLSYRIPSPKGNDEFTQIIQQFNAMCDSLQHHIERSYIYELQQRSAELYALQTSINPHFLYNTLEVIRVKLNQEGNSDAAEMMVLLSRVFRNQIKGEMFVSLYEEFRQCTMFIDLYLYRYENFEYNFCVPQEFNAFGIPKNTIQPIIENYFSHGIVQGNDENYIEIKAEWAERNGERCIRISVLNNGKPISEETFHHLRRQLQSHVIQNATISNHSFGLTNVNDRIRLVFGSQYGLEISPPGGGRPGFQIDIYFPPRSPEELMEQYAAVEKRNDEKGGSTLC